MYYDFSKRLDYLIKTATNFSRNTYDIWIRYQEVKSDDSKSRWSLVETLNYKPNKIDVVKKYIDREEVTVIPKVNYKQFLIGSAVGGAVGLGIGSLCKTKTSGGKAIASGAFIGGSLAGATNAALHSRIKSRKITVDDVKILPQGEKP